MRNTLKLGAILMVICSVAAVLLSLVYGVTSVKIAENERIANEKKRKFVMPQAIKFEEKEFDGETYHVGLDAKGNEVGSVIKAAPRGYSGPIKMTIGLLPDGSISAVELTKLDQQETPGLGAKVARSDFKDQFKGKKADQLKLKQDNGEIDAITAATITSRAATEGVREKVEKFLKKKTQ
jgi:electron transport complex protein RnfG